MGVSTEAHLIYGWEVPSWFEYHQRPTGAAAEEEDEEESFEEEDEGEEIDSIGKGTPYEMLRFCHIETPSWIFGFRITGLMTEEDARPIADRLAKTPTPEEVAAAKAWAAENGIPIAEGEPAWLLCSYSDY